MTASTQLQANGITPLVISVPTLQPLDVVSLLEILSEVRHVICVEEHFVNCGLGSMLARLKAEQSVRWGLTLKGIPLHFIHEIGTTEGLRASFGITAADIIQEVEALTCQY
jgi:transketolase